MAFNGGAPFGQQAQPAFGQPSQQSQPTNPFGAAANGSASPPTGKITFGARAAAKQPSAVSSTTSQPAAGFGAATGFGQHSFSNLNGNASNPFGQGSSTQGSQTFNGDSAGGLAAVSGGFGAVQSTGTPFGGGQQASAAQSNASFGGSLGAGPGGFGAVQSMGGPLNGAQQSGSASASVPFGTNTSAAPASFASANGSFSALNSTRGAFGGGLQSGQGFGALGGAAAPISATAAAESQAQNPFARLGGRVDAQPSNPEQPAPFGAQPNPSGAFGQSAQLPATGSPGQALSAAGVLGSHQPGLAFGSNAGPASGTNPFAGGANASSIKPGAFGRAANRQQQDPQQQQQQQQQQQSQLDGLQRPNSAARRQQQTAQKNRAPQSNLSSELVDPAALAARSARFGPAQQQSPGVFGRLSGTSVQTRAQANQQEDADGNGSQHEAEGSEQEGEQPARQMTSSGRSLPPTAAQPLTDALDNGAGPGDEMEPEVSVEGFCTSMCPDYQLRSRTQHANENSLEVVDPLGKGRTIDQLATKKWERNVNMSDNAALPNMFRTLPALKATERHLMDYLDSDDPLLGLGRVSMYLWDRQRSIRQDMAWQRMEGLEAMNMYEEHAMTAIYMDAEMSHHGDPGSGDNTESYHPGLVIEQLNKTLITLTAMYETALLQGRPAPNAAEFNTYAFIMLLVGARQKDALAAFFQRHILPYGSSPYVALALRLHRLVANDVNPWAFFKLVDKASYRLGLWLQFLFPKMRYLHLTRLVSAAGPSPETRPVAELTHAMWFDSEEETVEFLLKASLQPEQSSSGAWQLNLHRSLKVDSQAASFRQRSARLCSLQLPRRSLNVLDQAGTAAAEVRALVGGSMTMLSSRQPVVPALQAASQQQMPSQQPAVPQTPTTSTSQAPAFTWPDAQTPAPAPASSGVPWGGSSLLQPVFQQPQFLAADPSSVQKPPQPDQAQQQQEQQRMEQEAQERQRQEHQRQQAERVRLEQERVQRQQQHAQQQREAEQRGQAERTRQQQQAQEQAQQQQRRAEERRHQQQELQRQQQEQQQQKLQEQQRVELLHQKQQQAHEQERRQHEQQQQQWHQRQLDLEIKAQKFHQTHVQRQFLRHWRQLTIQRRAQYGREVILSKLASSFSSLRPGSSPTDQVAQRRTINTAQRPLQGHLESRGGSLQEALPLPALVAPVLAAANQEQPYLRWKAVIHYKPSAAAAQGPDFAAAKWLRSQMAYRAGAAHVGNGQDLQGSQASQTSPVRGIFSSVCDASQLVPAQPHRDTETQKLQDTMAGASVLVLLITRGDNPEHTEACLKTLLTSSPPKLTVSLLLLTTAPDLHHGVQQWINTLPGKLGELWQHISQLHSVCLAKAAPVHRASKRGSTYSRAALREGLKSAAASSPAQMHVKAMPIEQLLAKELEQQIDLLMSSSHLMPQAWISTFNQMLHRVWQQMNEAAAAAEGLGGWPSPELAAIDATLPHHWWTPSVLARFEGAISLLCLPGMPASLGAAPHQAVPIYVQHYLGIATSGASWQQILAAAMHSRIRAVQQQSLPPAVVLARCKPPPLLPPEHPACRLASTPGAASHSSNANATETASQLTPANGSISHNAQSASLLGQNRDLRQGSRQEAGSRSTLSQSFPPAADGPSAACASAANPSKGPGDARHTASYADVLMAKGAAKRKVAEADSALQESQSTVKRHQNGFDPSLSSLQKQTKQLQQLIAQSKANI